MTNKQINFGERQPSEVNTKSEQDEFALSRLEKRQTDSR